MNTNADICEKIIFLISQPRAGSTLAQSILGGHPAILAVQEPWLLLHPLYDIWHSGKADYEWDRANIAVQIFLDSLPNGEDDYFDAVRLMYGHLCNCALVANKKTVFLDKTPRYYLIIPELRRAFPQARFIVLFRNPLAVLISMIKAWDLLFLFRYKEDLLRAPQLLVNGVDHLQDGCVVMHYEEFITAPEIEVRRMFESVGLEFTSERLHYDGQSFANWRMGDRTGIIDKHDRPAPENRDKWIELLDDPQVWRLAHEYLRALGPELIIRMGYSYEDLASILSLNRPPWIRLLFTLPMGFFLRQPSETIIRLRGIVLTVKRSIKKRGWWITLRLVINRTKKSASTYGSIA